MGEYMDPANSKNSAELLMPVGSVKKLELAIAYGADAVYLGPAFFSLRARNNEFSLEEIEKAIKYVHGKGKKIYITLNIFARNRKLKRFDEAVRELGTLKPDAFIMSDPGLISIAKENAPNVPVHLSVQANCMNWKSVQFWKNSLDITRIILSRELSVSEIAEIHDRVPDVELEAFVHGSICIAYSGRCLLSSYMSYRDANQGVCDNSCREKFKLSSNEAVLEDLRDPGSQYPIEEDEHGTYIMNAKDLCMIEHLEELKKAGVVSFKVEGRTKSEFYSAMVARAYRGALDDMLNGKPFDPYWRKQLDFLSNRGYHKSFMFGDPKAQGQNYEYSMKKPEIQILGFLNYNTEKNTLNVEVKNKIANGQKVRVIWPGSREVSSDVIAIKNQNDQSVSEVHSGSGVFQIELTNLENKSLMQNALMISGE